MFSKTKIPSLRFKRSFLLSSDDDGSGGGGGGGGSSSSNSNSSSKKKFYPLNLITPWFFSHCFPTSFSFIAFAYFLTFCFSFYHGNNNSNYSTDIFPI